MEVFNELALAGEAGVIVAGLDEGKRAPNKCSLSRQEIRQPNIYLSINNQKEKT